MLYKDFGQTGHRVSALGFGGMRFEHMNDVDESAALVQAAYDAGITYFDTAIGYGGGKSEEIFGAALKQMAKTRAERPYLVATKSMARTAEDVRKQVETSLARLEIDCIDCYHVWCIMTPDDYALRKQAGVLDAFVKLREEGLIKHLCVSSHMTGEDIGVMLRDFPFASLLLGYSAMNFAYREAGVQAAAELGMGVVCMNPLGGGVIPNHADRFQFLRTGDETVAQAALRFLVDDPRVSVALVGFSNQAQLDEALGAVDGFVGLPAGEPERIRRELKGAFDHLCTGCRYCDSCPEGVPIPKLLEAYNARMLGESDDAIVGRLKWHWGIRKGDPVLSACIRCGACEELCTQKLPIMDRLAAVREIMEAAQE